MPDATATLNEIVGGLEGLANQAVALVPSDQSFSEIWGWNQPALNRHDIASIIRRPQKLIARIPEDAKIVDDQTWIRLVPLPSRITYISSNTLPNMPGGNAVTAYAVIKSLVDVLEDILEPLALPNFNMEEVESRQLLPGTQVRRLRGIDRAIDKLLVDSTDIRDKITLINDAHATAEALPADMQMLSDARKSLDDALRAAQINQAGTETARKNAEHTTKQVENFRDEAVKLVQGTQNAFSAATTKGLGEEFGNRAASLQKSVWVLGGILAVTLLLGGAVTYYRIEHINVIIGGDKFNSQVLWAHVALSVASIAAPVWFAWLLTKQIGQRFRLSEDYAFKASVAKAYAGYSQEAARIDPEFQKRLYGAALDRINEEPLRHVETDNHGSPLHELWGKRRTPRGNPAANASLSPVNKQVGETSTTAENPE